jgi:hypothetical protein|tara:strand:- start:265 stop:504 length:240 start_codon:yes stop_codon:yes gene_type:complete
MRLEQLLAIFSLTLYFASFLALAGFGAYLCHMAFNLHLHTQALTLGGLFGAHELGALLGSAIIKTVKNAKQPREKENEE